MGERKDRKNVYLRITCDIATRDHHDYFRSCARIRGISTAALLNRVLKAVADEQLVLAVLDDDSARVRLDGERRYMDRSTVP